MKTWSAEHRLLFRIGQPVNRLGAVGQQMYLNMTEGLNEDTDVVTAATNAVRNAAVTVVEGLGEVIPVLFDLAGGLKKKYTVGPRSGNPWEATSASWDKIKQAIGDKSIPRTISSTVFEGTDGVVKDIFYNMTGVSNTIIKPVEGFSSEVDYHQAA